MTHFSFDLISPAYAQASGGSSGFDVMGLLPLMVIFVAFYFLLIRPQQKKAQQQRDMLAAITRGEKVVTAGGVIGKVHSIENENEVILEVEGGTHLRILKSAIVERITSELHAQKKAAEGEGTTKTKPRRPTNPKKASKEKTIN